MSAVILSYPEDISLLQSFLVSGSYNHVAISSTMVLNLWEECDIDVPFVTQHFSVTYFLNLDKMWVSVLTTTHVTKNDCLCEMMAEAELKHR